MAEHEIFRAAAVLQKTFIAVSPQIRGSWSPNVDVFLTENEAVIKAELAGVKKEDLEVITLNNRVIIRGIRHDEYRGGCCRFLVMEINYGPFEAIIDLPAGFDTASAKAVYANGFLTIRIPTQNPEERGTRLVPVEETTDEQPVS